MTGLLLGLGTASFWAFEWTDPATLGPMGVGGKLAAGLFQGVQPCTAGFNSVGTGALHPETSLATDVLMLVGGGSAGTAGGIEVTTFAVLLFISLSEVRGDDSATAFGLRLPREAQRQALTIALLAVAVVVGSTGVLLLATLMFLGRLGPITLALALALCSRPRRYELPQERPLIG